MKKSILMSIIALFAITFGAQAVAEEANVKAPNEQETQEEASTASEQGSAQEETLVSSVKR
jgi:hypothetical protein